MDESSRLTKTKEQWAKARRGGEEREVFYEGDARLPPGQHLVETWPVLDLGQKPDVPFEEWSTHHRRIRGSPHHVDMGRVSSPSPSSRMSQTSTV